MKKILSNLPILAVMALVFGMFSACKPSSSDSFSVKVKEVGPEYVELAVTAPSALEISYMVDTKEVLMNNAFDLFESGEGLVVSPNSVIRINKGLQEKTQYYIYIVARLDAFNFSEIITLPFRTTEYNFDELLTVVEQFYDGYKMRITVPREVKDRGNGIRYNQCCIMMYNYLAASDDYTALIYNGGKHVTKSTTITYSEEENWYQTDTDVDNNGELDWDTSYNPVSPGEPCVFVAGEFAWMEDTPEYKDDNYDYPAGWDPGYYLPLLYPAGTEKGDNGVEQSSVGIIDYDMSKPTDVNWYGVFQRKHFRVKEPAPFDGKVRVECVESSPINLTLDFYPDENVCQYAIGVFEDGMYKEILKLCNNNEDYLQWAITSYFAAYTFGTRVATDAVKMKLTSFYYADAIKEDTKYHVLVTAMGDQMGTIQSFQKYSFWTTEKTKGAPEILVTPVEEKCSPYKAVFNIKCTTWRDNPAFKCCFAANYLRDWQLQLNGGATYWTLTSGNFGTEEQASYMEFYGDELAAINSDKGYEITIPSVDGETTRIAVAAYNDEYTPNNFNYTNIEDCPAVADWTTDYEPAKPWVNEDLYYDLAGKWIAEAKHQDVNGAKFSESSEITIAYDLYDYPAELTQDIYDLYAKLDANGNMGTNGKDKDEVDAMWMQFQQMAETITDKRLVNQNRLVGIGWIVSDQYKTLKGRTPYDLFVAPDYIAVDVSSLYNDYGPKWYIEVEEDADGNIRYFIPFDSNLMPPASNWTGTYYLGGGAYINDKFTMVTSGEGWTPSFPVTVSEDRNTITIHPLEYVQKEGTEPVVLYPNMVGVSSGTNSIENTIISEITLTRVNSTAPSAASAKVARKYKGSIDVVGDIPQENYKPRTTFSAVKPMKEIEGSLVSVEEFRERADKFIKMKYTNSNN